MWSFPERKKHEFPTPFNPHQKDEMVKVRAGLKVAHQHGRCWGHQAFAVEKDGRGARSSGRCFLKKDGDALDEGSFWWGVVTWADKVESEIARFKPGYYRVDRVATRVYVKAWLA